MKKLEAHPLATLWPRRSHEQREALRESLIKTGQQRNLIVLGNQIVDGNERAAILVELGVEPTVEPYVGGKSDADILNAIIAFNGGRHMEKSQRSMLCAEALPHFGDTVPVETAAKLFSVSRRYVFRSCEILKRDRKLAARVKSGETTLSKALRSLDRKKKAREWAKCEESVPLNKKTCRILTGDCRTKLGELRDASIDLVFMDPPYGIGDAYHGFDDAMTGDERFTLYEETLAECARVLKPNGSLWLMLPSNLHHDGLVAGTNADLVCIDTIIWAESFGQHNTRYFTDSYRVIHHFVKNAKAFTFNADDVRTHVPSFRAQTEDPRAAAPLKLPGNVWGVWTDVGVARLVDNSPERVPVEGVKVPNQLPVKLLERIVLLASNPSDVVLDPFHGTGTTAVASLLHGRTYVGCEYDAEVAEASVGWIKARLALFAEGKR